MARVDVCGVFGEFPVAGDLVPFLCHPGAIGTSWTYQRHIKMITLTPRQNDHFSSALPLRGPQYGIKIAKDRPWVPQDPAFRAP